MGFGGGRLRPPVSRAGDLSTSVGFSTLVVIFFISSWTQLTEATDQPTQVGYACEGLTLSIECDEGRELRILRANYGRLGLAVCTDDRDPEGWSTDCMSTRSLDVVTRMCDGKPSCWISATNRRFGDPCGNTPKYLEVQFECVEAPESTVQLTRPLTSVSPPPPNASSDTKPGCAAGLTKQATHEKLLHMAPTNALKQISRLLGSRVEKASEKHRRHGSVDNSDAETELRETVDCQELQADQQKEMRETTTAVTVPIRWPLEESVPTSPVNDKDGGNAAVSANSVSNSDGSQSTDASDNYYYYYTIYGDNDENEQDEHEKEGGTGFDVNNIPDHVDIDYGAMWDSEDIATLNEQDMEHSEDGEMDNNVYGAWSGGVNNGLTTVKSNANVVTHPTRPPPPPTTTTEKTTTIRQTPRPTMTPTPAPTPSPTTTTERSTTTTEQTTPRPTTTTERLTTEESLPTPPPFVSLKFCEAIVVRNISWPRTSAGKDAREPCPNNPSESGYYRCGTDPVEWESNPDLTMCASMQVMHMQDEPIDDADELMQISSQVLELTEKDLYGGDVRELSIFMNTIVDDVEVETLLLPDAEQKNTINQINQDVLKSSSNLLSEKHADSWRDLPQGTQAESAANIMDAVETSAMQVAEVIETPLEPPTVNIEVHIMMAVDAVDTTVNDVPDVCFPGPYLPPVDNSLPTEYDKWGQSGDIIRLPGGTLKQLGREGMAKLIFLTYENLDKLLNAPQKDSANAIAKVPSSSENKFNENVEVEEDHIFMGGGVEDDNPNEGLDFEKPPSYVGELEDDYPFDNRIPVVEEEPKEMIINSNIISATINDEKVKTDNLAENITYTLAHKTTQNVFNPTCSFWEYSERMMDGKWSQFGCTLVSTNVTHTTCTCNHLTNFAILMDVVGTALPSHHQLTLSLITYVGVFISLICLLFCWITFQFCKNLQCDRNTIHKHLVFNLFVAELIFIAGIAQTDDHILCSVVAGFLHYFFLVAFAWMCLEGIQLYMMLVEVFEAEKSRRKWYYLSAYGIPAAIVLICAAAYPQGYGTDSYCWLDVPSGFIWAFVAPVIVIITINIGMLSVAIYVMCRHAAIASQLKMRDKTRMEKIRGWIKGALVLVVLLGLTWSLGLLYINEQTVTLAYIFTILNSLQGLFIFIFHCLMDERVQKEYKRCVRHQMWLPDCIRVNYGGAKAYTSSSPNSSTSGNNYLQKLWSGRRRKRSSTTSLPKSSRSSVPNNKWNYLMPHGDMPNGDAPPPPFIQNSDGPEDYLEPVRISMENEVFPPIENEYATINGADLSMIDASTVDTEGLSEYCEKKLAIDFEKYKIQSPIQERSAPVQKEADYSEIDDKDYDLSDATLARLREKERMLEDYADHPFDSQVPRSESEQNFVNSLDDSMIGTKRYSSSSGSSCRESPSLNDLNNLNKERWSNSSNKSLNISTPNIKFKAGTLKKNNTPNSSGDEGPYNSSLPSLSDGQVATEDVAINKLRRATPPEDEGLISIYNGKKPDKRLSADTQTALKAHNMRPTSSDC